MKCIILAGGRGTRLGSDTDIRPKPMVEIGGKPIIWHIMKHLSHFGIKDFIIALGYRGEVIKKYFTDGINFSGNIRVRDSGFVQQKPSNDWTVELVDTGWHTNTAGRVKKLLPFIGEDNHFMVTYGDALTDLDMRKVARCKTMATVTAVRPQPRFGELVIDELGCVTKISEKAFFQDSGWINGGYMIFPTATAKTYLDPLDDNADLAGDLLGSMVNHCMVVAHKHYGFWACMDTARERDQLEELWESGKAPWKVWND